MTDDRTSKVPTSHGGIYYIDFMSALSRKRSVRRYLEVGVNEGRLMSRISTHTAVGVDPEFLLSTNIATGKKAVTLFQEPSDVFFSSPEMISALGGTPDLTFLDGLHTFEYLLRDFYNTEAISSPNSLIAMHDCLPLSSGMAQRNQIKSNELTQGTNYETWWTGDVWKIIPILKKHRPDLEIVCVDCPPTGVVFVTNLDPDSRFLEKNYMNIVKEFAARPNDDAEISALYDLIQVTSSESVINDFDHSLFFRT